jgi:hypothetical protein
MEPSNQSDDRWKELADLLGLPGDQNGSTPQSSITELKPPAHVEIRAPEPEPESDFFEEVPQTSDEDIEAIEEGNDTILDEQEESHSTMSEDDEGEEAEEGPPAIAADGTEEEKPKRGRRRRRRGRRRGGDKAEGEATAEKPTAARLPESREGRPNQPRQRDREDRNTRGRDADRHDSRSRRGRRDDEPQRPEVEEREELVDELEEVEMTPRAHVRNLDDDTDFSDWTVPSWQELISSLYRPDR